ncbi:MAG: flavodoxin family protein [Cellulosilyticaceae bacterium]
MGYKVVCFSRTGNSERVAKKIAKLLSTRVIKISDGMDWTGKWGYVRAGYAAVTNKNVAIQVHGKIEASDEIILVSPLWAGKLTPAARDFLKKVPAEKVHLIVTSEASSLKSNQEFKSVNNIIKKEKNEDEVIKIVVKDIIK